MMNTKSKILAIFMAAAMVLSLLAGMTPTRAWALEEGSSDELALHSPVKNGDNVASTYQFIWFAKNTDNTPIKWRILDKSSSELVLLSDGILTSMRFFSSTVLYGYYASNVNNGYMKNLFNNYFMSQEKSAVCVVNCGSNGPEPYLLSSSETSSSTYFPGGSADRATSGNWWLGSTAPNDSSAGHNLQMVVNSNGSISINGEYTYLTYGVRPAVRIKTASVLFASEASAGASAEVGNELVAVEPPAGDMKLTVLDNSQTLTIDQVMAGSNLSGSEVTVAYSGAAVSASNYLCAELAAGGVTHRGVIKALTAGGESGTAVFNLPASLTGSYTLRLWNEQYKAAYATNYACMPVSASIAFSQPVILGDGAGFPTGVAGTAYNSAALTAAGGTGDYTWSAANLPDGLSIDPSTGAVGGIPEDTGTFTVTVTVSDADSHTAAREFALTVYSSSNILPAITIVNGSPFSVTVYHTHGAYEGVNVTVYGDITGALSGNDTVLTGTLTGVPAVWTEVTLNGSRLKIRAVSPPSTTVDNPSFY